MSKKKRYKPVVLRRVPTSALDKEAKTAKPRFATIDIETQDWVNYVTGEVYWFDKEGREQSFETDDPLLLMLKCFEIRITDDIDNFVAHFGGKFDFLFFMQTLFHENFIEIGSIIPRGPSLLSFDAHMIHLPKHPSWKLPIDEEVKITFRDSSAILAYGLGSLTKSFGVQTLKGEMDFLFVEDVYKERCYLDKILLDDRCSLFCGGKQVRKRLTKDHRKPSRRSRLRYWNHDRYRFYPCREKPKRLTPDNQKRAKARKTFIDDVTFPIFEKKDLLLYLHHDCKSLYQCLDAWFDAPLICSAKKKWTVAGQAVEVFKMFAPRDLHSLPDDEQWLEGDVDGYVRRAYFGGRTEVFKPIFHAETTFINYFFHPDKKYCLKCSRSNRKFMQWSKGRYNLKRAIFTVVAESPVPDDEKDSVKVFDVNSLYPFVMQAHKYPDKFSRWSRGKNMANDYHYNDMSIWTAKVRVPKDMYIPPLPVKSEEHEGRLIFPTGEFIGHWTKHEIEYAKSLGCEVLELIEGAIFEDAGYLFKDFVNTLYNKRKEAKKNGDHVAQMSMKLLMNSCYGKMGQNKVQERIIIDDFTNPAAKYLADIDMGNNQIIRLSTMPEKSESMYSNPAIACFVTSYARVHLHKQFMIVGPTSVYYCDTDSVFTSRRLPSGPEVGQMKFEYSTKSACFLLPKTYVAEDIYDEEKGDVPIKLTMKGFDYKNIHNRFTVDDFIEFLNGDRDRIFATEKPRFATFKTALRMGTFVTMKNDPKLNRENDLRKEAEYAKKNPGRKKKFVKKEYKISVKKLQGYYTKRMIVQGGFDTKPIHLDSKKLA